MDAHVGCRDWTESELVTLREVYPCAKPADVMTALPGRSWRAIESMAVRFKVRRKKPRIAKLRRETCLARDLTRRRLRLGMSQKELAHKIGYFNSSLLARVERTATGTSLFTLTAWCDALGLELRAVPKKKLTPAVVRKRAAVEIQPQLSLPLEDVAAQTAQILQFDDYDAADVARWRRTEHGKVGYDAADDDHRGHGGAEDAGEARDEEARVRRVVSAAPGYVKRSA